MRVDGIIHFRRPPTAPGSECLLPEFHYPATRLRYMVTAGTFLQYYISRNSPVVKARRSWGPEICTEYYEPCINPSRYLCVHTAGICNTRPADRVLFVHGTPSELVTQRCEGITGILALFVGYEDSYEFSQFVLVII
jgi:hypothetical protein